MCEARTANAQRRYSFHANYDNQHLRVIWKMDSRWQLDLSTLDCGLVSEVFHGYVYFIRRESERNTRPDVGHRPSIEN